MNLPNFLILGLTNPDHVARYTYLNERMVVATHYYDEELLGRLGLLDDIRWLYARGLWDISFR